VNADGCFCIDSLLAKLRLARVKTLLSLVVVCSLGWVGSNLLSADPLLHNADLKDDISGWHGDGRITYLMPDGTEQDDINSGGTPVIKLHLSNDSESVYQEYETHGSPTTLNISVEAMAAPDFRRSTEASDYTTKWSPGGTWYWTGAPVIPTVDFWIRGGPGWYYKLDSLKKGIWTTVTGHFENLTPTDDHVVYFCVPPGDGTVYIKNPVVTQ
jgi:hypothetical protein